MTPRKRTVKKAVRKKTGNKRRVSDVDILQEIQDDIYRKLKNSDYKPRVADLIRVLNEKLKLKFSDDGRKKFWDLIEQIRKDELECEMESGTEHENENESAD